MKKRYVVLIIALVFFGVIAFPAYKCIKTYSAYENIWSMEETISNAKYYIDNYRWFPFVSKEKRADTLQYSMNVILDEGSSSEFQEYYAKAKNKINVITLLVNYIPRRHGFFAENPPEGIYRNEVEFLLKEIDELLEQNKADDYYYSLLRDKMYIMYDVGMDVAEIKAEYRSYIETRETDESAKAQSLEKLERMDEQPTVKVLD